MPPKMLTSWHVLSIKDREETVFTCLAQKLMRKVNWPFVLGVWSAELECLVSWLALVQVITRGLTKPHLCFISGHAELSRLAVLSLNRVLRQRAHLFENTKSEHDDLCPTRATQRTTKKCSEYCSFCLEREGGEKRRKVELVRMAE